MAERSHWLLLHGTPLTAIAAELDPVSTPEAMQAMAARAAAGRAHVLPGAAHMSPFVDPDALAELILAASVPW